MKHQRVAYSDTPIEVNFQHASYKVLCNGWDPFRHREATIADFTQNNANVLVIEGKAACTECEEHDSTTPDVGS
jgi:hypothetical protein